jgi:hypothetical protein
VSEQERIHRGQEPPHQRAEQPQPSPLAGAEEQAARVQESMQKANDVIAEILTEVVEPAPGAEVINPGREKPQVRPRRSSQAYVEDFRQQPGQ